MEDKEFIPYEEALALKELGFDEECLTIYYKDDNPKKLLFSIAEKYSSNPEVAKHQSRDAIRDINFDKGWAIKVPLYQQAFRWFREVYNLSSFLDLMNPGYPNGDWDWTIRHKEYENCYASSTSTYEKAELACLRKLIEIVKSNKNE